jgi:ribosomal protein S18 acetylase RimI-like enzyme
VRLEPPLRPGTDADAAVLAALINEASHGLALHAWTLMAEPGADPWTVGIARQSQRAREGGWVVADEGAGPVAGLLTVPPSVGPPGADLPAVFHPLVELEALAPDALYVNVLAALPEARGRGLGTRLMAVAEDLARAGGRRRLSLIVADDNAGARRLYARLGYRPMASRPMNKDGWEGSGEAWLLLVKDLA